MPATHILPLVRQDDPSRSLSTDSRNPDNSSWERVDDHSNYSSYLRNGQDQLLSGPIVHVLRDVPTLSWSDRRISDTQPTSACQTNLPAPELRYHAGAL